MHELVAHYAPSASLGSVLNGEEMRRGSSRSESLMKRWLIVWCPRVVQAECMVLFHNKNREDYSAAGIRNRLDLRVGTLLSTMSVYSICVLADR